MAQLVDIIMDIEGMAINQFSSLALSQDIFEHHAFKVVCPSDSIDGTSGVLFNTSKNLIGKNINIQIKAVEGPGSLKFTGIVTQVETSKYSGHPGDIIISGYSPTIILDNGPHCKSWKKKTLSSIVQDVLKHFPRNLLPLKVSPLNNNPLPYIVQYKETAWQFLCRLCANCAEWWYYDGQKIILAPPEGNKSELVFGSHLEQFHVALQARPAKLQMMGFDFMNDQVYSLTQAGIAQKTGLNETGKFVLQKSEELYEATPKQWNNLFFDNKKQLEERTNLSAALQCSNMIRFQGSSGHPGVQPGSSVSVRGTNIYSNADEAYGDYTILSVLHECDGIGNYTNQFEAIPSTIKLPPVAVYGEPHCESQSAIVTDNYDPKGLGRVRVKFHWMNGVEKSPWLRIASPHGGEKKGMFFIPEIGEEVIVGFEGSSAVKPFIIGTVYHEKAKTEFGNKDNDIKALQTRSGNKVIMNDKEGSIKIEDPSGNVITMHGNGQITINAPKVLTLVSTDIYINAESSINIGVGNKEKPDTANIVLKKGNKIIEISSQNAITAIADKELNLKGAEKFRANTKELNIDASTSGVFTAGKLTLDGGSKAIITSSDTDIF